MITTARPRAASTPAVTAVWWPKFREKLKPRTRESPAASSEIFRQVESVEPSSTQTISRPSTSSSRAAIRRSCMAWMLSSSFIAGITTLSSGPSVIAPPRSTLAGSSTILNLTRIAGFCRPIQFPEDPAPRNRTTSPPSSRAITSPAARTVSRAAGSKSRCSSAPMTTKSTPDSSTAAATAAGSLPR